MIVDPDFPDHWKTRMLVALLGDDEAAPVYVLRLWGHCQNRKSELFDMPTVAIKAICRFSGDAETLESALQESGFISRDGKTVTVCGWSDYNASLVANWENGKKGGRPPKSGTEKRPVQNPPETHGLSQPKPNENPPETHGAPDKRREDKRREEENTPHSPPGGATPERDVIAYLNSKAGRAFEPVEANLRPIRARMREGATVEQIRAVIDRKVKDWSGTDMAVYLRPETLFRASKFASYVGSLPATTGPPWWIERGFGSETAAIAAGEAATA